MAHSENSGLQLIPRLIRLRDAPRYLGMDRNRFNAEVRPYVTEIPIGTQGVAFDRLDLDAWVDQYKSRNGRPGQPRGDQVWDVRERQGCAIVLESGKSTRLSQDSELSSLLEQAASKKRRGI
jgi:predicted DNA-binding transcriptional regulator AlpA